MNKSIYQLTGPLFRYILFSIEPQDDCAFLTDWEYTVLEGFFNTTFTFRQDSDIFLPYARVNLKQEFIQRKNEEGWVEQSIAVVNGSQILESKQR